MSRLWIGDPSWAYDSHGAILVGTWECEGFGRAFRNVFEPFIREGMRIGRFSRGLRALVRDAWLSGGRYWI